MPDQSQENKGTFAGAESLVVTAFFIMRTIDVVRTRSLYPKNYLSHESGS